VNPPGGVRPSGGAVAVRAGAPVDLEHFVVAPGVGAPASAVEFVVTHTGVATN
jgi:hypothetical protein